MNISPLTVPTYEASRQYRAYRAALKQRKEKHLTELSAVYYQLSKGRKVIDVIEAFKASGMKDHGPAIALVRADRTRCILEKKSDGKAEFYGLSDGEVNQHSKADFVTPACYQWQMETLRTGWNRPYRSRCSTVVPLIPVVHVPVGGLHNYHILWEIDKWEPEPPVDPLLLKQITKNIFVVLAQWNLSPIERAVMRGAIQ